MNTSISDDSIWLGGVQFSFMWFKNNFGNVESRKQLRILSFERIYVTHEDVIVPVLKLQIRFITYAVKKCIKTIYVCLIGAQLWV